MQASQPFRLASTKARTSFGLAAMKASVAKIEVA
jgi:hypothetical protein